MPTQEELDQGYSIGDWQVFPTRRLLQRGDEEVSPENKVFGVLNSLALRGGDGVTRDELINEVWDGRAASDEVINRAISQLRGHLGDKRPYRYIKALQGYGYLLQEPVVLRAQESAVKEKEVPQKRPPSIVFRAVVVLALIAMAAAIILSGGRPDVRAIAVLPFENVSGDANNDYLAEGFKQELVKTLQPIPDVVIRTGRDAYSDKTTEQIARLLDVDRVLLGSLNRNEDVLKVSYELIDGSNNELLMAGSVTGEVAELFALQENLAELVFEEMFGTAEQFLVSASRPSNHSAYNSYLRGTYAFDRRGNGDNLEQAMRLFEETIHLDESFGPAYLQLAMAHALLPAYRNASLEDSNKTAISLAEQGIAVDESIREASGAVFGFTYHSEKKWQSAELAYQQATQSTVVDANAFNWYSRMLASVGRLDDALQQALNAFALDPDSAVIASRVAISYAWLNDVENASEFFARAERLGAEGTTHLLGWALFLARQGDIEGARQKAKLAASQANIPPEWIDAVLAGLLDEELSTAALREVNATVGAGQLSPQIEVVVRTLLGDLEGAMDVAELLEQPGEAFEMDLLWIPELAPLRRHPGFAGLMERLNVVEHWRLHNCEFVDESVVCADS